MATFTGVAGVIKVGGVAVAEIVSFTITETVETVDDTVKGDTYRTHKATLKTWAGEAEAQWDPTDTSGQGALGIGVMASLELYPVSEASGDTYRAGNAIVTQVEVTSELSEVVKVALSFQGSGELTTATVA